MSRDAARLGAILLTAALVYACLWDSFFVGFFNDDVVYIALARSLASGLGYREIMFVGAPPHFKYPAGYPVVLAPLSDSFVAMKLVGVCCGLAAVALLYLYLRDDPPVLRWGCTLLLACNPFVGRYASAVLTDVPGMFMTMLYLVAAQRLLVGDVRSPRAVVLLAVLAAAAFYLRTIGAVLGVCTFVHLLARRAGWRPTLIYAATLGALVLPHFMRQGALGYQGDIATHYGAKSWWTIMSTDVGFYGAGLPVTLWADPILCMGRLFGERPDPLLWTLCIATWATIVTGFATSEISRRSPIPSLGGMVTALHGAIFLLFWPYADIRFFVPILPLLIVYFQRGLLFFLKKAVVRGAEMAYVFVVFALAAVLLWMVYLTWRWPDPVEHDAPLETYAWIGAHVGADEAVSARSASLWLRNGRRIEVLPSWTGLAEASVRQLLRGPTAWVMLRGPAYSDGSPDALAQALDGRPTLFSRQYANEREGTRVYRIVGDRARFLQAFDEFAQGVDEMQGEQWEKAVQRFDACLALEPDFPPAEFNRALALRELGRKDEARAGLQKLLQRHPEHAKARAVLEQTP